MRWALGGVRSQIEWFQGLIADIHQGKRRVDDDLIRFLQDRVNIAGEHLEMVEAQALYVIADGPQPANKGDKEYMFRIHFRDGGKTEIRGRKRMRSFLETNSREIVQVKRSEVNFEFVDTDLLRDYAYEKVAKQNLPADMPVAVHNT